MSVDAPPPAGTGSHLLLNCPLHDSSLDLLIGRAIECDPQLIIDHGCGWGEVLLRAVAEVPSAVGVGVELHLPDLERARVAACERGLADRSSFIHGNSADHRQRADLLISLGSYQAFGDVANAARCLREDLLPGGRALFGLEYWAFRPTDEELGHMWPGATVEDCLALADIADLLHNSGWRIIDMHDSTRTEFDDFEVGHLRERELWLVNHPEAFEEPIRAELDQAWTSWFRGHRRPMRFVTFILA